MDTIRESKRDLFYADRKPEGALPLLGAEWVKTYSEYMKATDEDKLEKAQQLYDITMEMYDAEREILLEKHKLEMDTANELISTIETLQERQKSFVEDIDAMIKEMTQTVGSPGNQMTAQRRNITSLQEQIAGATGEDKLTLIEELKTAYANMLSSGSSLYGTDSRSYERIFEQVTAGLETIKSQYGVETDRMLDVAVSELDVLTGISNNIDEDKWQQKAILALQEKQRGELFLLNSKYQTFLTWFEGQGKQEISNIELHLENIKGNILWLKNTGVSNITNSVLTKSDTQSAFYNALALFFPLKGAANAALDSNKEGEKTPPTKKWWQHSGKDYVESDQWRFLEEGERVTRRGFNTADSGSGNFVFIPYPMDAHEQERFFDNVIKPIMKNRSKDEQFIYNSTLIPSNRGI